MAPEQAQGRVDRLDESCDVFGLGAILCEILTGQPPYTGSEGTEVRFQAAAAALTGAYRRLDACGADAELIQLARRCLAAEHANRPRDARSLGKEFTGYLESVEARLRQAELDGARARAKAEEERKRRRLTLALAGSVLLTVVLRAGAWLWIADEKAMRQRQVAEEKAKRRQQAAAEQAKRDLEFVTQKAKRSRQVQQALDRAVRLHDQARVAAAGESGKWAEARAVAHRAEALLEGGPVESELAGRVRTLNAALAREEKAPRLAARLDDIRSLRTQYDSQETRYDRERALPVNQAIFWEIGISAGRTAPDRPTRIIRHQPGFFQVRLVAALDDRHEYAALSRKKEAQWLAAVISQADTDRWRE
jgi:serine/threonine-protein kinase